MTVRMLKTDRFGRSDRETTPKRCFREINAATKVPMPFPTSEARSAKNLERFPLAEMPSLSALRPDCFHLFSGSGVFRSHFFDSLPTTALSVMVAATIPI